MSLLLLDINVLLALAWPHHQFHAAASHRFQASRDQWATCALTQLGFIRISSNPTVIPGAKNPAEAAVLLAEMTKDHLHVYLESLPAPTGREAQALLQRILGSKQVTDAYLFLVARRHKAKLATFDRRLQALANAGAEVEILKL